MKTKKDVLFLCQYFYPEYISSATLPFDTARALVNAGFSVGALCGYPKEYNLVEKVPLEEVHEGIHIKRLKYIQLKRNKILGRFINYFSFTFAVFLKLNELKKYKVIIVYSNPPVLPFVAAIANKFYKVKVIFVSYDIYPEIAQVTGVIAPNSIMSKIMNLLNKSIFKRVHKVVALSNEMKKFLLKHRPLLTKEQIEVIPNWYEDRGRAKHKRTVNNKLFQSLISDQNLVVSYFGNMGTGQDIETIIEAIKMLKDNNHVKFVFAGHGNKMPLLKKIVREEKLDNVYIYDFLHGNDFQDALSISDCFIVSLKEGVTGLAVPSKTYSYMMAGRPIIAIMDEDSDIAKDLRENQAGFIIQPGDSFKLVEIIKIMVENAEKREYMGKNARNIYLKKYTKNHCTQLYVKLLMKILEE